MRVAAHTMQRVPTLLCRSRIWPVEQHNLQIDLLAVNGSLVRSFAALHARVVDAGANPSATTAVPTSAPASALESSAQGSSMQDKCINCPAESYTTVADAAFATSSSNRRPSQVGGSAQPPGSASILSPQPLFWRRNYQGANLFSPERYHHHTHTSWLSPAAAPTAIAANMQQQEQWPVFRKQQQQRRHLSYLGSSAPTAAAPMQQQQQHQWCALLQQQPQKQRHVCSSTAAAAAAAAYSSQAETESDSEGQQHQQQQQQQPVDNSSSSSSSGTLFQPKPYQLEDYRWMGEMQQGPPALLRQQWQQWQQQQQQQQPDPMRVTVHAIHLACEVDHRSFANHQKFKASSVTKDHTLIEIEELSEDSVLLGQGRTEKVERRIMVIYRFGSVVFFNMPRKSRARWLSALKDYLTITKGGPGAKELQAAVANAAAESGGGQLREDEASVVVRTNLETWSAREPDQIVVQTLDVGNVRVISHVLAQSVALDYYNWKVDEAINQFSDPYLLNVAETGECKRVKEAKLLKLIAENSILYTDVVSKIGLLDISQTAWTQDRYHDLWNALRSDFEIERRFEAINRKLGPMLENAKFLLDIRAEEKSADAEKIIIGLIALEIAINWYGHFVM